jgi:malate dehydrogenase
MVDAISHDRKRILPCVCVLDGEYGEHDVTVGVPAALGSQGMERIIELDLNESELATFRHSLVSIRASIDLL